MGTGRTAIFLVAKSHTVPAPAKINAIQIISLPFCVEPLSNADIVPQI